MTLVAITYNPPQHSSFAHSNKWKKGLVSLFTNKFHHPSSQGRRYSSPTTVAAATEKILRHKEQPVIKCEDLTAKEFAQMAGIKIKQPEEETETNDLFTQMTTRTEFSSKSSPNKRIWDSDFWQCNEGDKKDAHDTQSLTVPSCNYIQKGRFKICVGQVDSEPVHQHHHVVLEWKRKRSDSSSTAAKKK